MRAVNREEMAQPMVHTSDWSRRFLVSWARGALRREATYSDFAGLSYEQASRRATAICEAAVETGQTIAAAVYLAELAKVMQLLTPNAG